MESILSALYPLASSIATPLTLASTTILLFFSLGYAVVKALRPAIEKVTGKDAVRVLMRLITYGFLLALLALVFAGISWLAKSSYERLYLKNELATAARTQIESGDVQLAIPYIDRLILEFPSDAIGHSLRGTAMFRLRQYDKASDSFSRASAFTDKSVRCDDGMRVDLSWSAALGASGDHSQALSLLEPHLDCENLPSGAQFNYAKLLFLSGDTASAEAQLNRSDLLTSMGPPDYRDRSYFLLAVLQFSDGALGTTPEENLAIASLMEANCLNPAFGRLALGSASIALGSPEGELMQSFELEVGLISDYLSENNLRVVVAELFSDLTNCS